MKKSTVKEIAESYQLTGHFIREEIKRGNLKAMKFGDRGGYRVTEEDLRIWEESKRKEN